MDPIQMQWVLENYTKEKEDLYNLIKSIFDGLKFWINPEMYEAQRKQKDKLASQTAQTNFEAFLDTLRKEGASEDDLNSLRKSNG